MSQILRTASTPEELEDILAEMTEPFDRAIERKEFFPYYQQAHDLLKVVTTMQKGISRFKALRRRYFASNKADFSAIGDAYIFRVSLKWDDTDQVVALLDKNKKRLAARASNFDAFYTKLQRHIELEVLPNDALEGERAYLAQGRLILQTTINTFGYHVFQIAFGHCPNCGDGHIQFKPLTSHGLASIDDAIRNHVDPLALGTIAIAKNTGHYPLEQTALPIVQIKYQERLLTQQ